MSKILKGQAAGSPMRLLVGEPSRNRIGLDIYPEGSNGERRQGMFVLVSEPELLDALNATKVEKLEAARQAARDAAAQCVKAEEKLARVQEALHEAYNVRGDWETPEGARALRLALLRAVAHGEPVLPTQPGTRVAATAAKMGHGRIGTEYIFTVLAGGGEYMYWKGPGYSPISAEVFRKDFTGHRIVSEPEEQK